MTIADRLCKWSKHILHGKGIKQKYWRLYHVVKYQFPAMLKLVFKSETEDKD